MTFREKLNKEIPHYKGLDIIDIGCPCDYDYESDDDDCPFDETGKEHSCTECWNREIPGTEKETYTLEEVKEMCDITDEDIKAFEQTMLDGFISEKVDCSEESMAQAFQDSLDAVDEYTMEDMLRNSQRIILDSGERRQFETGAVRDIQEGKGRCDLMPMDIVAGILEDVILYSISHFVETDDTMYLKDAIGYFNNAEYGCPYTMLLEVAKHFEDGAKKYGENNWQKGIPTKHYIDSAVRHYLKYCRGDQDEPHDRAFVWNLMCCMWTCKNMPELDSYRKD